MATNVIKIHSPYSANDIHAMWHEFYRCKRYNLPAIYNETFIRQQEMLLAKEIQYAINTYQEGRISASEFVSTIAQYQENE